MNALIFMLLLAGFEPPQASRPSFDCARAAKPVERAICGDPALGRLDRRMAEAYRAVRRALPGEARAALQRDQIRYLSAQDEWFENRGRPGFSSFANLSERMADRIALLESIDTSPAPGLVGRWRNLAGVADVSSVGGGRLRIHVSSAQPVNARWICEVTAEGAANGQTIQGAAQQDERVQLRATVRDGHLQIEELRAGGLNHSLGYCGSSGFTEGSYFRVANPPAR